jgi:DNA-binding PadR family transcriptional regulator
MNDLLLLAMLSAGPLHGYALKEQAGFFSGAGAMHNNLVYPLLRRFMTAGWVKRRKTPGQRGQTRNVYSLTPRGRQVLLERLGQFPARQAASAEGFHLRVGLFHLLDRSTRQRILHQRTTYLQQRQATLQRVQRAIDLGPYPAAVVAFLRRQAQSELAWIGRLEAMPAKSHKSRKT